MNSLYKYGVKGKLYNLIYELNKSSEIQIKTSVGVTESFEVGPSVAQGSIGGGLISSCNLDYSINKFFKSSNSEVFYCDLRIQPMIYQDDLGRFSTTIEDAQDGNIKIEACMEGKVLDLHQDKSCFIIFGNQKQKAELHRKMNDSPLKLYGLEMKEKLKENYLGDIIDGEGNKASAESTVKDRYGRILAGACEIRSIIEDCRSHKVGGAKAGIDLWEIAYIPSLLNNCETWIDISNETIEKLDELQNKFFRSLLSVPKTTPKPALIWKMGGWKMKWRIVQKKLAFMNHIKSLDAESLAYQVQEVQERENLPGLTSECKNYIEILNLPNIFQERLPKEKWKALVKSAVDKANEEELRESMLKYKKLRTRNIVEDKYGQKKYVSELSLHQTQTIFKQRT